MQKLKEKLLEHLQKIPELIIQELDDSDSEQEESS